MKSLEDEFENKERIWERIREERPDLSGLWIENVRRDIHNLPLIYSKNLLMSIASWALVTNGCRGTHGYPSPGALVSTWMNNPSHKSVFSMRELEEVLRLKHFLKDV